MSSNTCRQTMHDGARRRADRHPLGVLSEVFYTAAVSTAGVSAGMLVISLQWDSNAFGWAASLTAIPALILGFHSRTLRRRAIDATTDVALT